MSTNDITEKINTKTGKKPAISIVKTIRNTSIGMKLLYFTSSNKNDSSLKKMENGL